MSEVLVGLLQVLFRVAALLMSGLVKIASWWTAGFLSDLVRMQWMPIALRLFMTYVAFLVVPPALQQLSTSLAAALVIPALIGLLLLVGVGAWAIVVRVLGATNASGPWLLLPAAGALAAPPIAWVAEAQPPTIDFALAMVGAIASGVLIALVMHAFTWNVALRARLGEIRSAPRSVYRRP